jgi:hypothetical protein
MYLGEGKMVKCELDSSGLRPLEGFCDHGNELGFDKRRVIS